MFALTRLSARLEMVAALVPRGLPMADIGTDHARLPAALVQRGHVPMAIASDLRAGPLAAAARTLGASASAGRVQLRQADGLLGLCPGEVSTVVIAGLGGPSIAAMLGRGSSGHGPTQGISRIVLQPTMGAAVLRRALYADGWRIVHESLVEDAGRLHLVIAAEPGCGDAPSSDDAPSEDDVWLGPILRRRRGLLMRAWTQASLRRAHRVLAGLERATHPDPERWSRARALAALFERYLAEPG